MNEAATTVEAGQMTSGSVRTPLQALEHRCVRLEARIERVNHNIARHKAMALEGWERSVAHLEEELEGRKAELTFRNIKLKTLLRNIETAS